MAQDVRRRGRPRASLLARQTQSPGARPSPLLLTGTTWTTTVRSDTLVGACLFTRQQSGAWPRFRLGGRRVAL